jgi:hypothetical protein
MLLVAARGRARWLREAMTLGLPSYHRAPGDAWQGPNLPHAVREGMALSRTGALW